MQALQGNPDMADMVNKSQLATILSGNTDYKIPSGYRKSAGGGIEQIPGWVNSSRYKPLTYTDEKGNVINALIDVSKLQNGGPAADGQPVQPGQPTVGQDGIISLGTKKEKTMTVEAASKAAMMQQGMSDLKKAQPMLFNETGELDRVNATNAWLNTPGTEGRLIYSYYFNAINAKLRAESGAAVPEEEVKRGLKVFMPSPMDNDITAQEKITRLQQFMNTALTNMDATGRLVPADAELATWMSKEQQKVQAYESLPHPKTTDDFQAIPKGTMYVDPDDGKRYMK
ncbi:MAG: hypothetical protein GXP11_05725 [Gammaproteobacteria bacterium]|nr:hypothetical protein [Gammaproteobacteria bacterium]